MSTNAEGEGEAALRVGMTVRFVVLHHTGVREPHFDLMVEVPGRGRLLTWRVENSPDVWWEMEGGEIGALPIGDHRNAYMTYEGEISGGRGEVKRVAEGAGTVTKLASHVMGVSLGGDHKRWNLSLPM